MNKKIVSLILAIVCLLLVFAIIVQVKTVTNSGLGTNATFAEAELKDEVLKWKEKYEIASKELTKVEKQLEKQRKKATKNDGTLKQDEEELKIGNTILGLTDVNGEGVEIILKDNKNVNSQTAILDMSLYVVHDIDILNIVNELKNAGAEAISINEERIIGITSITCAGNVAQINGEKVGAPFVIKAIGNSNTLYEALNRPGGYIEILNGSGIITDLKKSNNISIEKYNGKLNFKFVKDQK